MTLAHVVVGIDEARPAECRAQWHAPAKLVEDAGSTEAKRDIADRVDGVGSADGPKFEGQRERPGVRAAAQRDEVSNEGRAEAPRKRPQRKAKVSISYEISSYLSSTLISIVT